MRMKAEDRIGEEFGIYKIVGVSSKKAKDGHSLYDAVCKECGFVKTARYQRIKDDIVSVCTHRHEYQTCYCQYCGKEIPIGNLKPSEYNGRKFCNASCAASYNNLHRKIANKKNNVSTDTECNSSVVGLISENSSLKYCLNCGKEIPTRNKYCSLQCKHEYEQTEWEKKWFAGEVDGNIGSLWTDVSKRVKTYLFKKYNNSCAKCGWSEVNQYTGKIPLEVEHIDGNPYNTTPDNVTLLCPNCHSLTRTYKGANKGNGRKRTWIPLTLENINTQCEHT